MRIALRVVIVVVIAAGVLFMGQGMGLVHGSFMTWRSEWAVIGAGPGRRRRGRALANNAALAVGSSSCVMRCMPTGTRRWREVVASNEGPRE